MIEIDQLSFDYRTFSKEPGLKGALQDIFHRKYQLVPALKDLNLTIKDGEIIGLIGPNGAGKTTLTKLLTGIIQPTSGSVKVAGLIPGSHQKKLLRQIGVMFGQKSQLSWNLPAVDTLNMLAAIYQLKPDRYQARLRELCDLLDIGEIVKTPVRKLSLGQRIRCELACSLIHEPSYLFLDEPTIGLDLLTQEKIYNFLKTENRLHQTTIILTSHNVRDIEALAQRLLILSKGELIFNDSLNKLPLQIDQSDSYCLKYWINDQTDVREEIIHDPQQLFVKMEKFQPEQIISLSKSGISAEEVILKIYQREKQ
ncbi:ABC transporter ATP-binding protein [Lactobacillus delbrueckii]|uniref:ABC transporter ATP-binding protein n=1 Tax=Lactobacillus delbrueckii TaxID=1584 RepID=UPI001F221A4E|nr:ABC transporter ATP-binding protein [Lactobacillus delbrueckii]MDK8262271.1 ABC transporter ATP-binding protein [Lactobacillus delbrueckii]GHN49438.1 ABC transporter ATP-binding protein [Lactobacillus delbrueckii]